ncbi:hypothetical protein Ocin01_14580 [Orchesella cincta]|uniref:Uncharacterized protein n=1 Tax=Orchesella cincta TaxID=48709 RepID=A0A1D2MGT0_ORCCI|nr:hypothetical protein Ocin01_14580 [Orchesella cincta]
MDVEDICLHEKKSQLEKEKHARICSLNLLGFGKAETDSRETVHQDRTSKGEGKESNAIFIGWERSAAGRRRNEWKKDGERVRVKPSDPKWGVIDWCITTESSALQHLQLLGPPHSPVCCDSTDDHKYVCNITSNVSLRTMMCMRRDLSLIRILDSPLLISVYIKLLPRAVIPFRLSLVLFDKVASNGIVPPEFKDKTNNGGASVKLVRVEGMNLDLSAVTRWVDL